MLAAIKQINLVPLVQTQAPTSWEIFGDFSNQGGVDILTIPVFECSLFSPDAIVQFEHLDTGR